MTSMTTMSCHPKTSGHFTMPSSSPTPPLWPSTRATSALSSRPSTSRTPSTAGRISRRRQPRRRRTSALEVPSSSSCTLSSALGRLWSPFPWAKTTMTRRRKKKKTEAMAGSWSRRLPPAAVASPLTTTKAVLSSCPPDPCRSSRSWTPSPRSSIPWWPIYRSPSRSWPIRFSPRVMPI